MPNSLSINEKEYFLSSHQLSSASDLDKWIVYRSIFGLDAMTNEGHYLSYFLLIISLSI